MQNNNSIVNVNVRNENSGFNANGDRTDGVLRVAPNLTYEEA